MISAIAFDMTGVITRSPIHMLEAYGGNYRRLENCSDIAVHDAIAAGVTDVVSPTPLLTMLTALRLHNPSAQRSS
jgi:hypothetical protein